MPTFSIDPRLAADTLPLLEAALCSIRLMNDSRYPWLILVPRRANLRELFELNDSDLARFWFESATVSRILMAHAHGEKLNVAALGNVVPQLHVHHVVRFASDAAWPAPVWGRHPSLPYAPGAARQRIAALRHDLKVLRA